MNWEHPYQMEKYAGLEAGWTDAKRLVRGYGEDINRGMTKGLDNWKRNFEETRKRTAEKSSFGQLGADLPLLLGGAGLLAVGGMGLGALGRKIFSRKAPTP